MIKIRAFNGHPPITVIARSLSVIFLPKHRSLTIDMLLDKHNNLQAFFNEHFILKRDISQRLKTAYPNTHIDDPCETRDNGLFCTVGMELNLTRSWFYAEYVMGYCWRRWRNQIDCIFHGSLVCKNFWNPLVSINPDKKI